MTCHRAALLVAFLCSAGVSAVAEPVTLSTPDGGVTVSGELLGYDGEFYRVDTAFGTVEVEAEGLDCDGPGCPDSDAVVTRFTISGAPSMARVLVPSLLESFAARNGLASRRGSETVDGFVYTLSERGAERALAEITFALTSSDESIADLIAREAEIALSRRPVTPVELALARTGDLGDLAAPGRARIVALDAIVPIVSVSNPIQRLDMGDLAAVFAGEITSWEPLGGTADPIALHLRDAASGATRQFADTILGEYGKAGFAPGITRHASNADLARAVAADPFALGLGSFSESGDTVALAISGPCNAAATATINGIKTEDYPLTTPLFAYIPPQRLPRLAREFLRFVASPAAQPVIRRAGFVDQFPAAIPLNDQGARLANAIDQAGAEIDLGELKRLVRALDGHSRLTVTFRFENGSSALDAQSRSNVALLAEALERGVFDNRTLLFAGFSDGEGPATLNRRISRTRADAVRDAVRAAIGAGDLSRLTLVTDAFGEALPMACDEAAWGRGVNRRVEVWLK